MIDRWIGSTGMLGTNLFGEVWLILHNSTSPLLMELLEKVQRDNICEGEFQKETQVTLNPGSHSFPACKVTVRRVFQGGVEST